MWKTTVKSLTELVQYSLISVFRITLIFSLMNVQTTRCNLQKAHLSAMGEYSYFLPQLKRKYI